jgi:hypothetical protein
MSGANFRAILSQKTDEVERPRALADGHYIGVIKTHEFGQSSNKKTPFCRWILTPEEETSDVPEGANAGIDFSKREVRKDFYITPAAIYRLSDALDAVLGKQNGRSFDERLPEVRGLRVLFQVGHRDSEDGTESYNDVGTIVAYNPEMAAAAE